MLCVDAVACARRYRKGLTAAEFACNLRSDIIVNNMISEDIRWKP